MACTLSVSSACGLLSFVDGDSVITGCSGRDGNSPIVGYGPIDGNGSPIDEKLSPSDYNYRDP